jgi:hypothetical protein
VRRERDVVGVETAEVDDASDAGVAAGLAEPGGDRPVAGRVLVRAGHRVDQEPGDVDVLRRLAQHRGVLRVSLDDVDP